MRTMRTGNDDRQRAASRRRSAIPLWPEPGRSRSETRAQPGIDLGEPLADNVGAKADPRHRSIR